jgi:hypothetical protein
VIEIKVKARYIFETSIGFFVMGLAIYFCLNIPNNNPSFTILIIFLIGLIGAFAPYIRIHKSKTITKFVQQSGKLLHLAAGIVFCLGIVGAIMSHSGLGILIGLMAAALIYSIGSGLKSV